MNFNRTYAQDFLGEMSPAGQRVQQALSPYQQFRVSGSVTPPQEQGFEDPLGAFEELDPADDGFLEKQTAIFQSAPPELFRSPSVQNRIRQANAAHAEAQTYFKEDPTLVDFYIDQRGKNIPPSVALGELRKRAQDNTLKGAFMKAGGLVDEYETLRDPSTGQVDRFKMLDYVNRREREAATKKANTPKDLTAEGYNRLLQAQDDLEAAEATVPTVPEDDAKLKADAFKKKYGRDPKSEQDWGSAYDLAYPQIAKSRSKLESLKKSYESQYKLPAEFTASQEPVNLSQQNSVVETPTPAVEAAPPQVGAPTQIPEPEQAGTLGSINLDRETEAENTALAEDVRRSQQLFQEIDKRRDAETNALGQKLSSLGDKDFVDRALRSVVQGEAVPPSLLGLPEEKDFLGGQKVKLVEDLIAQKLGVNPDDAVTSKGPNGKDFKLFHTNKNLERLGEQVTWRDLIKDYASKSVGQSAPVPIKSSVPNVTIGQIRQVP
jgi:hypothetical protein